MLLSNAPDALLAPCSKPQIIRAEAGHSVETEMPRRKASHASVLQALDESYEAVSADMKQDV